MLSEWLKTNAIAVLILLCSAVSVYASVTSRISSVEAELLSQKESGSKLEQRMDRQLDRVENYVKDLNGKVDRLLETRR
jgi:uncharacterized protein YccT (UPF0319 family)